MEQILVKRASGEEYLLEDRAAFRIINSISQKTELRSNDTIDVDITSRQFHDFKIGDTFYFLGRKYTLNQIPRYQKNSRNEYQYSATFEGVMYDLRRASYDVNIDTTGSAIYGETLTADLELFAKVLVENANRVFTDKWALGELPENTETKTITFSEEDNCLGVLQKLCDEYDTDFTISTDENGLNKINFLQVGEEIPLEFKVGFNQGLYNLIREKVDSSDIITRLKVYGSDQNLGTSYRSNKLVLPGKNKPNSYIENTDAIERFGIYEAVKVFDEIYPRRIGIVTSINSDSPYKFSDTSMDFDLNEKDENGTKYLIAGSAEKIHFNTGALAGYEFDVHSYSHSTKEFHIIKFADENGYEFPSKDNDAFRIAPGDEYVVLNIQMPQVYIDNAENELLQKANEYLSDKLEPNVQYSMDIDTLYLQRQLNETITEFFKVGDFIKVIDEDFGINRFIRIKSIERDLRKPFDYKLVLSDSKVTNLVSGTIPGEIKNIKNIIKLNNLNNPAKARRNWKDAQEVLNMVFDVEGDYYTDKIKPNSIETTHLQVGAKSMQFNLIDSFFEPNVNGDPNVIKWSNCKLVHFTIEDNIREWQITAGTKNLEANKAYYIYARCNKDNTIGVIDITEIQYTVDQGNYYYFLIGIVNSYDTDIKAREVSLMYGFSTFSGRFIKAGRIESSGGGNTYFDLDTGEISGKITFTNDSPAFEQINNSIIIGGRNLMQQTEFKLTDKWIYASNVGGTVNFVPSQRRIWLENINNTYIDAVQNITVEANTKYTLSFLAASDKGFIGSIYAIERINETINITPAKDNLQVLNLPTNGRYQKFTFTITTSSSTVLLRFGVRANSNSKVHFRDLKLEKGTKATDWTPAPEDIDNAINKAQNDATAANNTLSDIASDNKLSPSEKQTTLTEWNRIKLEYQQNILDANKLNVSATTYTNAYNALNTYLTPLLSNLTTTTDIVGNTFRSNFNLYYEANVKLLTDIQNKLVDSIEIVGRNLVIRKTEKNNTIVNTDGSEGSYMNNSLSNFTIKVIAGTSLVFTKSTVQNTDNYWRYKYVNSAGNLISRKANNLNSFTDVVPNNAVGLVVSYPTDSKVKISKGTNVTDWSAAPEDVQQQITELDNTMKRIDGVTSFLGTTIDQNVIATGVLMVGSEFQSNAGISGLNESGSKSVRQWAGGTAQNRNKAAWNVLDDGTMNFYHPNGQIAFKFGLENGVFAMNGYHKDGYLMFRLDPNRGLVNVAYSQESWSERKFFKIPVTNINATDDQIRVYLMPLITNSNGIYTIEQSKLNYQCWEYFNGTIPSNADWQQYNGYKASNNSRTANISNGWYLINYGPLEQDSTTLKPAVEVVFIEAGVYRQSRIIVMTNL
ncbi:hypothetical protein [Chishuiella changwenlii]|uniref:hypothetical protein n=1 Tax=Chishuiella changwenlii TaxID=1434701 RepID=UPI002FDAACF7